MTNLPEDPMYVLTITWTEDRGVVADIRGVTLLEAYALLELASQAIMDRLEECYLIADDEDADDLTREDDDD